MLISLGINPGAAQLLTGYEQATGKQIFGVGIDTPSVDHGPSTKFETHIELSKANIYSLENVANLEVSDSYNLQWNLIFSNIFRVVFQDWKVLPVSINSASIPKQTMLPMKPPDLSATMKSSSTNML